MKTWASRFSLLGFFCTWRLSVARELWWNKLENGNKQYQVLGVQIEHDAQDPELKAWIFIFFTLSFTFGIVKI